jgi:hypothetical protein
MIFLIAANLLIYTYVFLARRRHPYHKTISAPGI